MSGDKQGTPSTSNIAGKVALVTGSSDKLGIGLGIARSLASRGCPVILTGSRKPEKVEQLRTELESEYGVTTHYIAADFSSLNEVEKLIKDIKQIYPNGVDILVNNAELFPGSMALEKMDISLWEKCLRVNLTAPFYLVQLTLPDMKRKGWGRIINMCGTVAFGGAPQLVFHGVGKHGLAGLTKTVALETLGSGVTCNAIAPGTVRTQTCIDYIEKGAEREGVSFEEFEKMNLARFSASGKYVETQQVGELAAFLCSPAADQMTGTCIPIDGGDRAK